MKNAFGLGLGLVLAAVLVGCGGSDEPAPVQVAQSDVTLPADPSTTNAVAKLPFTFPQGVTEFGTTASTSLTFTDTATTPAFSIASGTNTATGTTRFGSCVFAITASSFPAGSKLALGNTIIVNPCNIKANTAGEQSNGLGVQRSVALILGAAVSAGSTVTLSVNAGGQLTINGNSVGTVTLVPVSG